MIWKIRITALLLALASTAAHPESPLEKFDVPVHPKPGVYFDPTQAGTGLTIDSVAVGADTFVFSTYYHYDANGAPTWMNFGNFIRQASMADYTATGLPATIRSEWNHSTGGACFDCPFSTITTTYPPYGERVFNVLNGSWVQLPASGNAPVRNMRLGKRLPASGTAAEALLTSGSVWSITRTRNGMAGVGDREYGLGGWLIIKPRPVAQKIQFGGNRPGVVEPAWLQVADKNTPTQYEFHKVFPNHGITYSAEIYALIGSNAFWYAERPDAYDHDEATLIVDAQTGNLRMFTRCTVQTQTAECPNGAARTNATILGIGDVQDAGQTAEGLERLVIRHLYFGDPAPQAFWFQEYELTRVPDQMARALAPNLPSGYAGKP